MSAIHTYRMSGHWSGDKNGTGTAEGRGLKTVLSVSSHLGGPGIGTSPEELLLAAAYGCYLLTLSTLLTNHNVPYARIELESEGYVEDDHGLRFDRIEHRPTIYLKDSVNEQEAALLAEHAEHACMVSSAIRGNVLVTVTPQLRVEALADSGN